MENKLGLSDEELEEIMDELFAVKSKMVDYRFRFGSDHFGLTYLLGLHDFLFGDVYYGAGRVSSRYTEEEKVEIDNKILNIVALIKKQDSNISQIAELINELVDAQIFEDGNSRTIHLFFDNVINCFFPEENDYTKSLKEEIKKTGRKL
jgi:fido (protein-threonine AMPylation protein)